MREYLPPRNRFEGMYKKIWKEKRYKIRECFLPEIIYRKKVVKNAGVFCTRKRVQKTWYEMRKYFLPHKISSETW